MQPKIKLALIYGSAREGRASNAAIRPRGAGTRQSQSRNGTGRQYPPDHGP
jgi:hypothetical protein